MRVLKFGGTSVGTPDRIRGVAALVKEASTRDRVLVVVSAFAGVTNALIAAAEQAARGDRAAVSSLDAIDSRHREAVEALASPSDAEALGRLVGEAVEELRDLLHGVSLVRECTPRTLDSVVSYGERLSAPIAAAAFRGQGLDAHACDARDLVLTDARFGSARVDFGETYARIRTYMAERGGVPVVTGFIAGTRAGETTTLGRGGSDYTAALFGAALDAAVVEIWTDVDGVMSADPRLVPDAFSIPSLSYDELMELSHFGAKVVYPPTVHPARERAIPLVIKNTLNPAFPGTRVTREGSPSAFDIRGISSISRVALLRLEGDGMVGVPGIAGRLFGSLAREGVNVILITQASSEHSICVAVDPSAIHRAREAIQAEFALERGAGLIDDLVVEDDMSIVAVVGEGMHERPGIAGRVFGVLGARGVNVRAISQGSSELNISVAIPRKDEATSLRAIHAAFFAGDVEPVYLAVVGTGRVGAALLDQIAAQAPALDAEGVPLRLVGLANSRHACFEPRGIRSDAWRQALEGGGSAALEAVAHEMVSAPGRRVFVDCTASDATVALYEPLLAAGVAVVAANKRGFARDTATHRRLRHLAGHGGLYYETTVGAGLPVLRTVNDLVRTGDAVTRIEACLSGTIGYLMDRLSAEAAFSAAVREAHERGYTEPDPRDDLSGTDVARKLVILAREAGFTIEPGAVGLEPLLPGPAWAALALEDFWRELPRLDAHYRELSRVGAATKRRLAYIGRIDTGGVGATLQLVGPSHPAHGLAGTDNLVAIWTRRYSETPLVVRGPGAGPAVTAGGLFADILRAVAERPAAHRHFARPSEPA